MKNPLFFAISFFLRNSSQENETFYSHLSEIYLLSHHLKLSILLYHFLTLLSHQYFDVA